MTSQQRFHVLINARSGTALRLGREHVEQALANSGLETESFHFLEPEEFDSTIRELVASPYPVLIGGGDGTIARAAALHLKKGRPFGIIPFGTMNLLAQDLDIPIELEQCFAAYRNTRTLTIDLGMINDRPFLCCAALGTMPEAAILREENRDLHDLLMLPRLSKFVFNQLDHMQKRRIKINMDGRRVRLRTGMLVISNNLYNPQSHVSPFKKETLQDGVFGVYTATPRGIWNKIKMFAALGLGTWKNNASIREYHAENVVIETDRNKELVSIDGEPIELETPLECHMLRQTLSILTPMPITSDEQRLAA